MDVPVNLSDPTVEPTDEELAGLIHRAFAGVAEARSASLRAMYAEIATEGARRLREHAADIDATLAAREMRLQAMARQDGRAR